MLDIVFSNWGLERLNVYIVLRLFLQYTVIAKKVKIITTHFLNQDLIDVH